MKKPTIKEVIDLLSRHHEVNIRQNPETYNDCDLARDTETALVASGVTASLPPIINFAYEMIKHMYSKGYDATEQGEQFDTSDELIEHIESINDGSVTIAFTKFGEKTELLQVVDDVDPDETAADFSTDGELEKKWDELNAANS